MVDDVVAAAYDDDGNEYGPVHTRSGWIGLRQMGHTIRCEYSRLAVYPLDGDSFEARREKLLEILTDPRMVSEDQFSGGYNYRRAWQHYTAHLARGTNLAQANEYFATSEEIKPGEWPALAYVRTYIKFRDTRLSRPAGERLRGVLEEYWKTMEADRYEQRLNSYGTNGNHSITAFSTYLLLEQVFGKGRYHDLAMDKFLTWV
ncbi:MAG: hypothetical protein GY953_02730, partial [bacterium]|nr:hypothetical protein [bacterium]